MQLERRNWQESDGLGRSSYALNGGVMQSTNAMMSWGCRNVMDRGRHVTGGGGRGGGDRSASDIVLGKNRVSDNANIRS